MHALVIDDEAGVRRFVAEVLREDDWAVSEAETAESAFERLHEERWSLVFCDVMLGGEDGYEVLKRFHVEQPQAQVILMTGHGSAVGALDATAFGAYDYLLKPFSAGDVQTLSRAIRRRMAKRTSRAGEKKETGAPVYTSDIALIGQSAAFVLAMKMVGRVAPTNLPVLITGESGEEALRLLALHDVALLITDQRMPNMTGIELLKRTAALRPHMVRIILTGYTDIGALVEAINSGLVYKYDQAMEQ